MSGEGFGQPQILGYEEFNIKNLRVIESPTVPGDVMNIIDAGESFTLELTFELKGSSPLMDALKSGPFQAKVEFRGESVGFGGPSNWGTATKPLVNGVDTYTASFKHLGINADRLYTVGAMVTIENKTTNKKVVGITGFYEGLRVQIHSAEA